MAWGKPPKKQPSRDPSNKGVKKGHDKGVMKGVKSHECRTCEGDGMVTRHYQDRNGKWQKETTTCSDCGGSGEINE